MLKILVIGALIAASLVFAKQEHAFNRAGVVGTCTVTRGPYGDTAEWHSCKEGLLTGFPNLGRYQCTLEAQTTKVELWRCATPLGSYSSS